MKYHITEGKISPLVGSTVLTPLYREAECIRNVVRRIMRSVTDAFEVVKNF